MNPFKTSKPVTQLIEPWQMHFINGIYIEYIYYLCQFYLNQVCINCNINLSAYHNINKIFFMKASTVLVILTICVTAYCYNFHVFRKIALPELNQATQISMVADDQLAIVKGTLQQSTITVLQGDKMQNKIRQITAADLASMPKVTSKEIYINTGKQLNAKKSMDTVISFVSAAPLNGNMQSERNYALVSKKLPCPTLLYLNLTSMTTKYHTYETGQDCVFSNFAGYVKDIKNGEFAYAIKNYVYIIDNQNLNVKAKIIETSDVSINYIDFYRNSKMNISPLLLQTMNHQVLTYIQNQTQPFQMYGRFYNPISNIFLTGEKTAVSFQATIMHRWRSLKTDVVALSFKQEEYLLGKQEIAVSRNEDTFVVSGNNKISFYTIDAKYQIKELFSIVIEQATTIRRNSGQFTADDKHLFVKTYSSEQKQHWICKIDLQNQSYEFVKDQHNISINSNCQTFAIVQASKQKLVAQCITYNPTTNLTQNTLQIRDIENLFMIRSVPGLPQPGQHLFTILYSLQWQNRFILQTHDTKDTQEEDNCLSQIYQLSSTDQVTTGKQTTILSYYKSITVDRYIASMDVQLSENSTADGYLVIYDIDDFVEMERYWYRQAYYLESNFLIARGNILIVQTKTGSKRTDVYNMVGNDTQNWFQGSIFKQYYQGNPTDQSGYFIFPHKGLYYKFNNNFQSTERPTKLIYDIDSPQIQKSINMVVPIQTSPTSNYLYIPKEDVLDNVNNCNYVFFMNVYDRTLKKYQECTDRQTLDTIDIDRAHKYAFFTQISLYKASDHKHIILVFRSQATSNYIVEVREITSDIAKKVWSYTSNQLLYNLDFTSAEQLLFNSDKKLSVMSTGKKQYSDAFGIDKFDMFDVNQRGCLVVSGTDVTDNTRTKVIYRDTPQSTLYLTHTFNQVIALLVLDTRCEMFVTYAITSKTVDVWSISQNKLINIYSHVWDKVQDIKFMGQHRLAVQFQASIEIVDIGNMTQQQQTEQLYLGTMIVAITQNGQLIAKTKSDFMTVSIVQTLQQKQVAYYSVSQGQAVTGISFSPNNTLVISTNKSNLVSIIPTPCPPTYMSINLQCVCRGNSSQVEGYCKCDQNFVERDSLCVCADTFQYSNGECRCDYGYVDGQVCYQCSFPCETCSQSAGNCLKYRASFIVIIVLSCVAFVAIVVGAILFVRARKAKQNMHEERQKLNTEDD